MRVQLTFAGAEPDLLAEHALASELLPRTLPTAVEVNHELLQTQEPLPVLATRHDELDVTWGQEAAFQRSRRYDRTYLHRMQWELEPESMLSLLCDWPFEACTTAPVDPTWWQGYRSIHGWGFLLKGADHRLVSKRIFDRGPWRLLRNEATDVTLFQFHDFETPADTALEQARPGHALLAPVWQGGHYASQTWVFRGSARSYKPTFYDSVTKTSIVLVQEREVTPEEMGIASATRVHQVFPEPVAQVAFVYFDEATAWRQLPLLWLHGLEVRVMNASGERRIDSEYEPPPPAAPPPWVQRLG